MVLSRNRGVPPEKAVLEPPKIRQERSTSYYSSNRTIFFCGFSTVLAACIQQWEVCLAAACLTATGLALRTSSARSRAWLHRVGGILLGLHMSPERTGACFSPHWVLLILLGSNNASFEEHLIFSGVISTVVLSSSEPHMGKFIVTVAAVSLNNQLQSV